MAPTRRIFRATLSSLLIGGAVAQLGERLVRNEEVRGSNPLGSTIPGSFSKGHWSRSSLFRRRSCRQLVGVAAAADGVIAPLTGRRGLAPCGFMIEREPLELVQLRRRNCDVAIGPAVGGGERFVQHGP